MIIEIALGIVLGVLLLALLPLIFRLALWAAGLVIAIALIIGFVYVGLTYPSELFEIALVLVGMALGTLAFLIAAVIVLCAVGYLTYCAGLFGELTIPPFPKRQPLSIKWAWMVERASLGWLPLLIWVFGGAFIGVATTQLIGSGVLGIVLGLSCFLPVPALAWLRTNRHKHPTDATNGRQR